MYAMTFEGKGTFLPTGKVKLNAYQVEQHNLRLECNELLNWHYQPKHFCGYITKQKESGRAVFTTWRGELLGYVSKSIRVWSPVGGTLTAYWIRGTNGAWYYGRHGGMDFIRVRRSDS